MASPPLDSDKQTAIDFGAAALAVHICDWHHLPVNATDERKRAFASEYPAWALLVQLVNGVKHPHRKGAVLKGGAVRELEWEDADFWLGSQRGSTVVVSYGGKERSVRALVIEFCNAYLAKNPAAS